MAIPKNAVDVLVAQGYAATWRKDSNNLVKGFLIPRADIFELYGQDNVQDVRAYMGVDENGMHKLLLVGVDAKGKDLIDPAKGYSVYDFTAPCPNTCDKSSVMFNIKDPE